MRYDERWFEANETSEYRKSVPWLPNAYWRRCDFVCWTEAIAVLTLLTVDGCRSTSRLGPTLEFLMSIWKTAGVKPQKG